LRTPNPSYDQWERILAQQTRHDQSVREAMAMPGVRKAFVRVLEAGCDRIAQRVTESEMTADETRERARVCLQEAQRVFEKLGNERGQATVKLYDAYLAFDVNKLPESRQHLQDAIILAGRDKYLLARIHAFGAQLFLALRGSGADGMDRHLAQAVEAGAKAVELAQRLQNRRLLGRSQTWLAFALAVAAPAQLDEPRRLYESARRNLAGTGNDYAFRHLHELRSLLYPTTNARNELGALLDEAEGLARGVPLKSAEGATPLTYFERGFMRVLVKHGFEIVGKNWRQLVKQWEIKGGRQKAIRLLLEQQGVHVRLRNGTGPKRNAK